MQFTSQLLSDSEKERIHEDTLKVLETVGVRYYSDKALNLLESAGARVDREEKIAHISPALVEQALSVAPKTSHWVRAIRNTIISCRRPFRAIAWTAQARSSAIFKQASIATVQIKTTNSPCESSRPWIWV